MAEIPVSSSDLNDIITLVAHELYEKWAVEDRFDVEEREKYAENAVDDTLFVIESYMMKVNEAMAEKQREIITPENKLIL